MEMNTTSLEIWIPVKDVIAQLPLGCPWTCWALPHIFVQGKVIKLSLLIFRIADFASFNSFIISYLSLLDKHFPPVFNSI